MIKAKYSNEFQEFISYFEKNYLIKKPFDELDWNFRKVLVGLTNENEIFLTNIIIESYHSTLNLHKRWSKNIP